MKYAPRFTSLDATMVHVGEVEVAVYLDRIPLAVPAQYFEMLFRASEEIEKREAAPAPRRKPALQKRATIHLKGGIAVAKPKRGPKPKDAPVDTVPQSADGDTTAAIVAALSRKPMTSGELIAATGKTASAVYSQLSLMRKAGRVLTSPDDDGTRRNHLAAAGKAA